jgi:hypothetical protein
MQKLIIPLFLLFSVFACTGQKKVSNSQNHVATGKNRLVMKASRGKVDKDTL